MARPRQPGLTENELEVMRALWKDAPLKVSEVLQRILAQTLPRFVLNVRMPEFTSLEVGGIKRLRGILTRSSQVFATGGVLTRSGQLPQEDMKK